MSCARSSRRSPARDSFRRWGPHAAAARSSASSSRLTGGRVQVSGLLVPSLVLHTVGAKSGEPRDAPLMYTPDGRGRAIVAGTNFAGGRHPAWTNNLLAHPDAAITVRGRRMPVRASLVPAEERDAVWDRIERQWPGLSRLRARLRPRRAAVPAAAGPRRGPEPGPGLGPQHGHGARSHDDPQREHPDDRAARPSPRPSSSR